MTAKFVVNSYNKFQTFRFGLKKKTISVNGSVTYTYLERGHPSKDKPSLLLVHGYSANKYNFLAFMGFLSRDIHVIAVDLPGHGDTPQKEGQELCIMMFVKSVHEFVLAMGLDQNKFHLLGASMGGEIVGLYASEYPEHLESLVLVCPLGIHFEKQQAMIDEGLETDKFVLLPETNDELREMFNLLLYTKPKIPEIFISGILQQRLEHQEYYKNLAKALVAPESFNLLEKNLHKITMPTLLLWGKEDAILDVECVETILEKLPTPPKQTVVLDEVGHGILFEVPEKGCGVVQEFFESLKTS